MRKRDLLERLRLKKQAHSSVVGVAWYPDEAHWRRVKAAATDSERFEETYVEWTAVAVEAIGDLKRVGVSAVKVFVVPDQLLSWCLLHNKPNNAASRAEFVAEKLRSQSEAT